MTYSAKLEDINRQIRESKQPTPIECGLDGWVFTDQRSYLMHLQPRPGREPLHVNPEHIDQLHWNSQAWEIIPFE